MMICDAKPFYLPYLPFMPNEVKYQNRTYKWTNTSISQIPGYWTKYDDYCTTPLPDEIVLGPEPVNGPQFGGGPVKRDPNGKEYRACPEGHQADDGTYYKGRYGLIWKYGVVWKPSGRGHFSKVGSNGDIVWLDDAEALDVSHLCNPLESPYGHEGDCINTSGNPVNGPRQCILCWKHACAICGFRTNRHCIVKCLC